MIEASKKAGSYEARSVKDNLRVVAWIFIWMGSLVVSDKAALYGWWSEEWLTLLSIVVNVGLGLMVIRTYLQMLGRMDDLQRKIQLEALGLALGISLVGACAYSLLVTWGYIVDEEVSDIFVLMCVSYAASSLYGVWKYR
jgi:hypothetical protein